MNSLPIFGPHPCLVYLRLPYIGVNSVRVARQALQAIKSRNDYVDRTSQRFHVGREQHVTKKDRF